MASLQPVAPDVAIDDGATRWPRALAARASRERGRRTLARLLDAAVAEFEVHGFRGARVSQVAKQAGTSHGTFYVYFEDKADLLVATLDDVRADLDEVLLAPPALAPGPAGLVAIEAWLDSACVRLERHAGVLAALTDAVVDGDDVRLQRTAMEMITGWTDQLARRIAASGADDLDPATAAGFLIHLVTASTRAAAAGDLPDADGALAAALAEVVQRSLFGVGAPAVVSSPAAGGA